MSRNAASLLIVLTLSMAAHASPAAAETYYVATDGSDDYNGLAPAFEGGSDGPFATLQRGAEALAAGDTLYLRAGTYHETVWLGTDGTETAPITVAGYTGEIAIIDGAGTIPEGEWGAMVSIEGSYYVFRDLEVSGSTWMGVVSSGVHNQIISVYSHHHMENGIILTGDYDLAEGCRVFYNCMSNEFGSHTRPSWASGLSAARHPQHATIRRCAVWNNWGEGLSTFEAEFTTIEDNVVYDNQTNIYLSDTTNTVCQRNLVYSTPGNVCAESAGRQVGIMMGDERYTPASSDNTVINNFLIGNKHNFYWWQGLSGGGLVNVLVAGNTFVDSSDTTNVQISEGDHVNTRFVSNIIVQNDDLPIAIFGPMTGVTFSHNLWSKAPPEEAAGEAELVADPLIARTGTLEPGSLGPDYFLIAESSPARDSGLAVEAVTVDFFGTPRDAQPDRGGHEYTTTPPVEPDEGTTETVEPPPDGEAGDDGAAEDAASEPTDTSDATDTPPGEGPDESGMGDEGCGCRLAA
jgi:hypothetical protein